MRLHARLSTRDRHGLRERKPYPLALILAVTMIGLVAFRLGEFNPSLAKVRPVLVTVTLVLVFLAWNFRRLGVGSLARDRIIILAFTLFTWAIVTIPFALWKRYAFEAVFIFPVGLLLLVMISVVPPQPRFLNALLKCVVLLGSAVAALSLHGGHRVFGRLTTAGMLDPNDLAGLLGTVLPFAVAVGLDRRSAGVVQKAIFWSALALISWSLLQTGSRGGTLAMIVGVLLVTVGLRMKRLLVFLLTFSIAGPVIWANTPEAVRDRLRSMTTLEDDYNLTEDYGRIATWKRGVGYILRHPLTGVGFNNFSVAEGFRLMAMNRAGTHHTAHNAYIQVFAELGIPGGVIFLLILFDATRRAFRLWRQGMPEYLASLGAWATNGLFLSHGYSYALFGLLGIIVLASRIYGSYPVSARLET